MGPGDSRGGHSCRLRKRSGTPQGDPGAWVSDCIQDRENSAGPHQTPPRHSLRETCVDRVTAEGAPELGPQQLAWESGGFGPPLGGS